jgi:hypothetical protein
LLDVRVAVATSTVGVLFEMRTALQLREGNAAMLVGHQVRTVDWSAEPVPGMTAWTVVGSQPTLGSRPTSETPMSALSAPGLTLDFYPDARLKLVSECVAFYVIVMPGIGPAPPDHVSNSAAAVQAGLPCWGSPVSPLHATYAP